MKADACLAYLRDRAGEWVTITTQETLAALRELHSRGETVEVRFRAGVREARYGGEPQPITLAEIAQKVFDATPSEEKVLCAHPGPRRRETSSGIACGDCGEILGPPPFRPKQYAPDDKPWEKWAPPEQQKVVATRTCQVCGEEYIDLNEHVTTSVRHSERVSADRPPEVQTPDQEPTYRFPDNWTPTTIRMGEAVVCPHCHGKKRPAGERVVTRKLKNGRTEQVVEAYGEDEFCHEPRKRGTPCRRCGGWGLVPLAGGPVPQSTEVMDVDAERAAAARAERRARYAPSAGQVAMDVGAGDDPPADQVRPRSRRKPSNRRKPIRPVPDPLARPAESDEGVAGGDVLPDDAGQG